MRVGWEGKTRAQSEVLAPLFPFDPEIRLLEHDLALVRFLAGEVLVPRLSRYGEHLTMYKRAAGSTTGTPRT